MLDPALVKAHINLTGILLSRGEAREALSHCEQAARLKPGLPLAQYNWGKVLVIAGEPDRGKEHLREAIRLAPGYLPAVRDMAWFLATHPENAIRDPNEAIKLGERAQALTGGRDAGVLDVLGAAYASHQEYRKATETTEKALAIANRLRDYELAGQIQERLQLYQYGCSYYENPRVQLDRLVAKAKREQVRDNTSEAADVNSRGTSTDQEVQDEVETISAE
jgi:tetratricopeptide (TPR) repeat protein